LAGGFHQRAVHVDGGQVEEGVGLPLPDALANLVEDRLQRVNGRRREAAAEVASGGWIGDTAGAEGVEKIGVVATQFDVFEVAAAAKGIVSDVEDMIGLGFYTFLGFSRAAGGASCG